MALWGAGDTINSTAHKSSSGSFTQTRFAAKAASRYVKDLGSVKRQISADEYCDLEREICQQLEAYRIGHNGIAGGAVNTWATRKKGNAWPKC